MSELWMRYCSALIGQPGQRGLLFSTPNGHKFDIDVKKNTTSAADKAKILIYGLSNSSRRQIESLPGQALVLDAGYRADHGVIFKGKIDEAHSEKDGADLVTVIEATDFTEEMSTRVLELELKDSTSGKAILEKIAEQLGVKIGSLTLKNLKEPKQKTVPLYDGPRQLLNEVCSSLGLYWHITDGLLFTAPLGLASRQEVIALSRRQLIGKAERGSHGIKGVTLLRHTMNPGCMLQVAALDEGSAPSDVVVLDLNHKGRSWEGEWYSRWDSRYRSKVLSA